MNVVAILLNTYREAIRNKITYSVIFFAALLLGITTFYGTVTIGSTEKVIKDSGLFLLNFFGVIIAILLGVTLLNKELKQKTIYNILSKPVTRWQFVLGKYLGLTLTTSTLVAIMGLGLALYVSCFEGRVDYLMFQGIFFTIFEVSVIASIVIFFSSLAVTITLPGLLTFATFIVGHSIDYLNYFITQSRTSQPSELAKLSVWALNLVLPDLSLFNINEQIIYGSPVPFMQMAYSAVYALSYSTCAIVLAMFIFSKRELN